MALYVVGDFFREARMRKGYTQEEVSFGICTPASLSRIENGVQTPGRCVLDKLMERLGMENNAFNLFVSKEEMELYEAIQQMTRNIADGDFVELEKQIQKVETLLGDAAELERQYLNFAKAELLRKKGGTSEEVMELLMEAIHITIPQFDGKKTLENNLLTFDEIMIINCIAVQYAEDNQVMAALRLGYWLKEYMEQKMIDGKLRTAKYPAIVYNMSNWLAKIGEHEDALKIAEEGVDFCVKYGNLMALPLLVFNKACSLAELGRKDEAKKFFTQSVVIFETMKQYDRVQTATDWCKEHYQIEI